MVVGMIAVLGSVMTGSAWAGSPPANAGTVTRALAPDTAFYVNPDSEAAHQAVADVIAHDFVGALNMAKLATWPEATWITKGTPSQVEGQASALMRDAARQYAVPVLVPYYIPLRLLPVLGRRRPVRCRLPDVDRGSGEGTRRQQGGGHPGTGRVGATAFRLWPGPDR